MTSTRDKVRAQAWREAMPFPLVRVVVDANVIAQWLLHASVQERANYEAMLAADMIDVRDTAEAR